MIAISIVLLVASVLGGSATDFGRLPKFMDRIFLGIFYFALLLLFAGFIMAAWRWLP